VKVGGGRRQSAAKLFLCAVYGNCGRAVCKRVCVCKCGVSKLLVDYCSRHYFSFFAGSRGIIDFTLPLQIICFSFIISLSFFSSSFSSRDFSFRKCGTFHFSLISTFHWFHFSLFFSSSFFSLSLFVFHYFDISSPVWFSLDYFRWLISPAYFLRIFFFSIFLRFSVLIALLIISRYFFHFSMP